MWLLVAGDVSEASGEAPDTRRVHTWGAENTVPFQLPLLHLYVDQDLGIFRTWCIFLWKRKVMKAAVTSRENSLEALEV